MFRLDNHLALPLYRQLYDQIRERILTGGLAADSRLPSVRDLSAELSVSRNTVEGAYQELHAEGYLYSKPRSGYFVSGLHQDAGPVALPRKSRAREPEPATRGEFRYDLHPARLAPGSFPADLWRKCFLEILRESPGELVQYGTPQGDLGLRRSIQRYLEGSRGVLCDPEQVVVCAGLQHGLEIIVHLLRGSDPVLAVEDPGYFLPRVVFESHACPTVPVPVGAGGIDPELLRGSGATVAYLTPSHQLPTGCVMPVGNRLALIEWAQSGGRFIIEDDYDSELRYHGKPIPSLQGLRPDGNVIYAGTFSKILSPALRLSYLVLPHSLLASYRRLYRDQFSAVSLLEQRTLARFMERGHWERHVRRMRAVYKKKHDLLLETVERQLGARVQIIGQGAGLHVVLQLSDPVRPEADIIERAAREGINLFPFSAFCSDAVPDAGRILLGFGGLDVAEIGPAVALLSRVLA